MPSQCTYHIKKEVLQMAKRKEYLMELVLKGTETVVRVVVEKGNPNFISGSIYSKDDQLTVSLGYATLTVVRDLIGEELALEGLKKGKYRDYSGSMKSAVSWASTTRELNREKKVYFEQAFAYMVEKVWYPKYGQDALEFLSTQKTVEIKKAELSVFTFNVRILDDSEALEPEIYKIKGRNETHAFVLLQKEMADCPHDWILVD